MAIKRKPNKRRNGQGSWRYLEAKNTWRYRVSLGDSTKDFYGKTKEEALTKLADYQARYPGGPPPLNARQPLNDLLATWVETEIKEHDAVSTYESYLSLIRLHIAPHIGTIPLCDLTRQNIQTWVNKLSKTKGSNGQTLGRSVELAHSVVRTALNYAVDNELIAKNPALRIRLPERQIRKAQAMEPEQVQRFLMAACGSIDLRPQMMRKNGRPFPLPPLTTRLYPLYLLYCICGPRRGEPLDARWEDFDLVRNLWHISRSVDGKRRVGGTKTESSVRTIALPEEVVAILKEHRRSMQTEDHREGWKADGLVFPTTTGRTLSPTNIRKHFKTVLEAAGLSTSYRLHDLRHTAGSLMLASGANLIDVSKVLGHSSPVITGDVYAHSYEQGKRAATDGASDLIKKAKKSG